MGYQDLFRTHEQTKKRHVMQRVPEVKLTVFENDANGQHTEKKIKCGFVQNSDSVFDQIPSFLPFEEWDHLIFHKANSAVQSYMTKETVFTLYSAPAKANEYWVGNQSKEEVNDVKTKIEEKRWIIFNDHRFLGYELALYKKHSC